MLISDDTKLGGIVNTLEDRKKIQNAIDKLGKQAKMMKAIEMFFIRKIYQMLQK